jgi:hypothetical protein
MFHENAHCLVTDNGVSLKTEESLQEYLRLLEAAKKQYDLKLPAYALLPDRALLYFVTPGADLHSVMGTFAKGGNLPGYKAGCCKYKLIQPEGFAAHLARYIHMQPVKEQLSARPEGYRWSSAAQYIGGTDGPADIEIVLKTFPGSPEEALAAYSAFLVEPVPGKFWRPFDKNRDAVLGDREFLTAHSPHGNRPE